MIFGQDVAELRHASRYSAPGDRSVIPSVIPEDTERVEIITGGLVEFEGEFYGRGAIFRHIFGESTVHLSAPGRPYRCLSLSFRLSCPSKRDFPRLTFWQDKNTLDHFVSDCVKGFHLPTSSMEILGAYAYSTINWHSNMSVLKGAGEGRHKGIRKAVEFLDKHTESWIPIDELARISGMSPSYFQSVFKRRTGATPHQYHLSRRIGLACERLSSSDTTVAEISSETGFDNIESFYRAFKRFTGTTPAAYRRTHSAKFW
ncbi:MAG: helix-turn-helix transcriptional regulator [Victivallales bacterium]|nr:helix-turn-helix transcriptional regulator [Victivallales bacterium]